MSVYQNVLTFNTNVTPAFGLQNNLCEFTTREHKFKR